MFSLKWSTSENATIWITKPKKDRDPELNRKCTLAVLYISLRSYYVTWFFLSHCCFSCFVALLRSECCFVALTPYYFVSLLRSYYVTMSLFHPLCHFVTLLLCHFVTLLLCHFVTLSLCHFVTLLLCYFVT